MRPVPVLDHVRNIGAAGPATFSRPEAPSAEVRHPQRWVATGQCFGPFGADDGVGTWALMISDFAHEHPARVSDEDAEVSGPLPVAR